MNILIFIVVLIILIIVHEFGHFVVAKRSGIRVDEFGIGYPPRIWGYKPKDSETTYSINWIPFGGFVKIFGEDPDDESIKGPDKERSFVNKNKWIQAAVLVAGVFFNFIFAWLLLSLGFMTGLPSSASSFDEGIVQNAKLTLVSVLPDSPASLAGLEVGDTIDYIGSTQQIEVIDSPSIEEAQNILSTSNYPVLIGYTNITGESDSILVSPQSGIVGDKKAIGVSLDMVGEVKLSFFSALWYGGEFTIYVTKSIAVGLYNFVVDAFVGQADFSQIAGPIGIVGFVGEAAKLGFVYLLSFTAIISLNLAILNLIPFPALDGGRLLFILIEKIKGSPITPKVANVFNSIGFVVLIIIMLLVTYNDIIRIVSN
jgi:regulator of sigma E protease